jgi:hypothetical protein
MKNYKSLINNLPDLNWTGDEEDSSYDEFNVDYIQLKKQFSREELIELALVMPL